MPDDPTPDDTERSIDDAEADFLDDRPIEEYPAVLRITAESDEAHRRDVLDRIERWEAGEAVPHVVNFQNPSDLRALLTDRRVELLQSVMSDRPDSIRDLADRLDRDVKTVHDDLSVLAEYDVVHFERDGRAKRPVVPYETIEVRLAIEPPDAADDLAPA
ncbi:MAG: transcriptional regulator [Halococcoides sp.]